MWPISRLAGRQKCKDQYISCTSRRITDNLPIFTFLTTNVSLPKRSLCVVLTHEGNYDFSARDQPMYSIFRLERSPRFSHFYD